MVFSVTHIPFYAMLFVSIVFFVLYSQKMKTADKLSKTLSFLAPISALVLTFFAAYINTAFDISVILMLLGAAGFMSLCLISTEANFWQELETVILSSSCGILFLGVLLITGFNWLAIAIAALLPFIIWLTVFAFGISLSKKDSALIIVHSLFAGAFFGQTLYVLASIPFNFAFILLFATAIASVAYIFVSVLFYHDEREKLKFPRLALLFFILLLIAFAIFII